MEYMCEAVEMNYLDRLYNWPTQFVPISILYWRKLLRALGIVLLWIVAGVIGYLASKYGTGQ